MIIGFFFFFFFTPSDLFRAFRSILCLPVFMPPPSGSGRRPLSAAVLVSRFYPRAWSRTPVSVLVVMPVSVFALPLPEPGTGGVEEGGRDRSAGSTEHFGSAALPALPGRVSVLRAREAACPGPGRGHGPLPLRAASGLGSVLPPGFAPGIGTGPQPWPNRCGGLPLPQAFLLRRRRSRAHRGRTFRRIP